MSAAICVLALRGAKEISWELGANAALVSFRHPNGSRYCYTLMRDDPRSGLEFAADALS